MRHLPPSEVLIGIIIFVFLSRSVFEKKTLGKTPGLTIFYILFFLFYSYYCSLKERNLKKKTFWSENFLAILNFKMLIPVVPKIVVDATIMTYLYSYNIYLISAMYLFISMSIV